MERFFEKTWNCPACSKTGISALRNTRCPGCAHPSPSQDEEIFTLIEITDEDGIALAKGGPHWVCSSCGTVNLKKNDICDGCGNPKDNSDHFNEVRDIGRILPVGQKTSVDNDLPNHQQKQLIYQKSEDNQVFAFLKSKINIIKTICITLAILIGFFGLLFLLFDTTNIEAEVSGFSWQRSISIEKFESQYNSGWGNPPSDAYNITSEIRQSGTEPIYETKIENVWIPDITYVDNGNGSVTEVDNSHWESQSTQVYVGENPIYDTWYTYYIDSWVFTRTEESNSNDRNPFWPKYTLYLEGISTIGAERVGGKYETYNVFFIFKDEKSDKKYTYSTDENSWKEYEIGKIYFLKLNHLNMIINNPLEGKST